MEEALLYGHVVSKICCTLMNHLSTTSSVSRYHSPCIVTNQFRVENIQYGVLSVSRYANALFSRVISNNDEGTLSLNLREMRPV